MNFTDCTAANSDIVILLTVKSVTSLDCHVLVNKGSVKYK